MAPAAQLALFPQQTGTTLVGSAGMEWHAVEIRKHGTTATWTVDGLLIVTIDLTTVTLGGGNIFFGHSDMNATSSADPNDTALLFTLIDNVKVTEFIAHRRRRQRYGRPADRRDSGAALPLRLPRRHPRHRCRRAGLLPLRCPHDRGLPRRHLVSRCSRPRPGLLAAAAIRACRAGPGRPSALPCAAPRAHCPSWRASAAR